MYLMTYEELRDLLGSFGRHCDDECSDLPEDELEDFVEEWMEQHVVGVLEEQYEGETIHLDD